ncbi:MAG: membrane dipeptidase [Oscillospiraceae bacterium]|nr:membrane dipeptidase [Oscillospiraceae bacterium]
MEFPVFDLHCDTANELIGLGGVPCSDLRRNSAHIDLERAGKLPGYTQCFACFTTTGSKNKPADIFEKKLSAILSEIEKNKDMIQLAYTAEDIETNLNNGMMSAVLTIEGSAGFGFDPAILEDLYKIGFRITSLGWNEKNPLTGSCVTGGGLTDMGASYVREAQRLGMLIDVSHISDEGFWDIMDITDAPVIATHSNSRHMWNVKRNLTDEMFLEICKTGGVAGINLYPDFLGENATLDTVCDHVFHFLELDPTGTHISLGGDLDGIDSLPKNVEGIQSYPAIAQHLIQRGLDNNTVMNIFWNNAVGVMKKCCM